LILSEEKILITLNDEKDEFYIKVLIIKRQKILETSNFLLTKNLLANKIQH